MSNFYILKLRYRLKYFNYLLKKYINKNNMNIIGAKKFVQFNNKRVLKVIKNKTIKKISILLPHCIQKYDCTFKITNDIDNCKLCGLCDIADIIKLKDEFKNIDIKVASGGTLARLYLKEYRPNLVIAVACERDLISGINDAFPLLVYGIFNKIINTPCKDTKVSLEQIKSILREVNIK